MHVWMNSGEMIALLLIASLLVMLAVRKAVRTDTSVFNLSLAKLFKEKFGRSSAVLMSALKSCPKCTKQLALSTLVCDNCEYNFLSMTIGHRHKLLPAPDAAPSHN